MAKAYCPNCDAAVIKDNPRVGVMITCRDCNTELEIISTNPFEVDFPIDYDDEEWSEDWDDDEDVVDEDDEEEEEEDQY
jgi:lysine biosynthesis protein LysW